jgi:hypothetical protein
MGKKRDKATQRTFITHQGVAGLQQQGDLCTWLAGIHLSRILFYLEIKGRRPFLLRTRCLVF